MSSLSLYDWTRIRHLLKIGIFGALMVLAGDMLLGWGIRDDARTGMDWFLSAYPDLSDGRIFWSAFLGLIGIPLEALCYFAVYRLIAPNSPGYAHLYRSGILGTLAFAGCGVHVPCLACVYVYKTLMRVSPDTAVDTTVRFGLYFLLPGMILFFIFWIVLHIAQIGAFVRQMTPYPKWCWVFCPAVGMGLTMLLKCLPESPARNALTAGWISIGNLWMFCGLLLLSRRAQQSREEGGT
ncbi:MAG: hypothetical protein IJT77_03350 [Clostridia bacterium]|nr:hypothetical protein [Clostridia bacterium]